MKKTMKRILLWLLTLLLLSAPVTALAAETDGSEGESAPEEEMTAEEVASEVRDLFSKVAERVGAKGTDLWESFRSVLSEIDLEALMTGLKNTLRGTRDLTDEQLREKIRSLAEDTHLELTDAQVERLVKLCRQLEKLNADDLRQKVENWRSGAEKLEDVKDTAEDVGETAGAFFRSLKTFFQRVGDMVSDLLGGEDS